MNGEHGIEPHLMCYCFRKTPEQVRAEIVRQGIHSVDAVYALLLGTDGCTCCRPEIENLLRDIWGPAARPGDR